MKYPIWFFRLVFAAWMIPAGLNHFVQIFPQPMGTQPLSMELVSALIDSHLFDLVKAVELLAGIGVLFGIYTPLCLLICLPVSFGVFYWDAPLEGWGSGAAIFGYSTLFCNVVLCLAYYRSYLSMFAFRAEPAPAKKQLVLIGRIVLGAILVLFAANILFLSDAPAGAQPLAEQLMTSLVNSRLLYVALVMQLVAGILLLAGVFVPLALAVQMSITSNALFWSLLLDQSPLLALLTLAVFAINAVLMIALLPCYKGVLDKAALAAGEDAGKGYDDYFIDHRGSTSKGDFIPAVMTVLVTMAFYWYFVPGRSGNFSMFVLVYPLFIVLIRRFRDMGQSPWLVFTPLLLVLLAFDVHLGFFSLGEIGDGLINWLAILSTAAAILWGSASGGGGEPVAAPT